MQAGHLRHRVVIEEQSVARADDGGEVVSWESLATVWAAVEPLAGREFFSAEQFQSELSHRVRLRYRADVSFTPKMRVAWDGRTFDVESVLDVGGRRRELHLMCMERQ